MAKKDFTKRIGSKNLSSLIPTGEPYAKDIQQTDLPEQEKSQQTKTTDRPQADSRFSPKPEPTPASKPKKQPVSRSARSKKKSTLKSAKAKAKPEKEQTTVTTFRINTEKLAAIKALAFWERKKIQEIFDEALGTYLNALPGSTLKKAQAEFKKRNS